MPKESKKMKHQAPDPQSSDSEEQLDSVVELDSKGQDSEEEPGSEQENMNCEEEANADEDSDAELEAEVHKEALKKLQQTDPEFYSFLEENAESLLHFDMEDEDDSDGEQNGNDDQVHTPGDLEVDSDESDFESEDAKPVRGRVTLKMVAEWQTELQSEGKVKLTTLTTVIKAFNAAMLRVTSDDGSSQGEFKVEGSSVFNAVIQVCVINLPDAIRKYLGLELGKDPQKCKHFTKIRGPLVAYLNDLLKLLSSITSENIMTVLLKHLHQLSVYIACFTRIAKLALKKLITLWSTGEETVRVLAFLCILRVTRNQQKALLDIVLKTMYLTYVKNCKFVSPTTWPGINFMRRSLVEMFSLDLQMAYRHVFLYIRQLAIHLRNAVVVQKIENRQAVYNWQFVNSLHLWGDLVGATGNKPQMQPLIYPLVMVTINTIKLVPTHQYYPLRFHCAQILMKISKETETFVPVLPFLTEVLSYDFNKKHKKVSMKPLDFSCILRLAKSQLMENGFKDAVIEKLYALFLEYTANESHTMAFPDTTLLAVIQLKQFLRSCSVANYTKKFRQLLEKIEENIKFIENERAKVTIPLGDERMVKAWEAQIKAKGTPLFTFYENWNKINSIQRRKRVTNNEELAVRLPQIKRARIPDEVVRNPDSQVPVNLFPSDSEDDKDHFPGDKTEATATKPKTKKLKKKKLQKKVNKRIQYDTNDIPDKADIVQDLSVNDW